MIPVQRPSVGQEELEAVGEVFKTAWLGMGSVTKEFEDSVGKFLGAKNVVAVNTGTTALHLAFDAAGLGPGDEVIVPSLTYVATIQAITATGARPVFCDVQEDTLNLDPRDAEKRVTPKTKAIVPVHYRGMPCDMDEILALAKERGLRVIEDAAHAFGSHYKGKRIGSFGDLTCFSFDPIKNITCGEGGAVVTHDAKTTELLQRKRILGIDKDTWSRYRNERSWFYDVTTQGYRCHMSNVNAAIGLVQLKKFKKMNDRKVEVAKRYDEAFSGLKRIKLLRTDYNGIAFFMYIVKVLEDREGLMGFLKEKGIGTGIHYIPSHVFTLYKQDGLELPATEALYKQILTLPLFPDISDEQAGQVISAVREWDAKG
ncbi:MAG: DegT/DnrJ/EryC1/StrS family aminotransferase [Candidatus Aenigmatarchaeota archaeon]